jgi:peptide/nickel transport system substrate-binding protein
MFKRLKPHPFVWGIWVILLITACRQQEQQIDDRTVFRYNEHANVTTLDPAFAKDQRNIWVCNQLYNGLVKLDNDLKIAPDLAHSWDVSEDALSYTFYLKKGVQFHTNPAFSKARTVTAHDFKFSFERLSSPELAAPGSWVMDAVDQIIVKNDHELTIQLKEPFPAFLGLLTMKYCSVIPREAVTYYGNELRNHPVGTGPFYLKRWEENVKMVLRRHPGYFEKDAQGAPLPYLEAVAITFKPDKQSEFLEFAQGNIDFINGLDPSYKDELLTSAGDLKEKYEATVVLKKAPFLNTEYLGLNLKNGSEPIKSKLIREAINLGFDREKMIKYLRNNVGKPALHGFIPLGLPSGGQVVGYEYNPEKASKLIEAYLATTGNKVPTITISTGANYLDLCEYIQRELEKIGMEVKIDVMPPSTLRQLRKGGQLEIFRSSWIADYPDAENYLALFYSKNQAPDGSNYTFFEHPEYDLLYEKSLRLANLQDRLPLYIKMDSIIVSQAPIVPLFYDESVRFISTRVTGLQSNAVNMLDLKSVKKVY